LRTLSWGAARSKRGSRFAPRPPCHAVVGYRHQPKPLICRDLEPSAGLEPAASSLPWPRSGGECLGGIPHECWVFGPSVSAPPYASSQVENGPRKRAVVCTESAGAGWAPGGAARARLNQTPDVSATALGGQFSTGEGGQFLTGAHMLIRRERCPGASARPWPPPGGTAIERGRLLRLTGRARLSP